MRVLRFHNNVPEWTVPLDELSDDLRRMLNLQWREFIHGLDSLSVHEPRDVSNPVAGSCVEMLERIFFGPDATLRNKIW